MYSIHSFFPPSFSPSLENVRIDPNIGSVNVVTVRVCGEVFTLSSVELLLSRGPVEMKKLIKVSKKILNLRTFFVVFIIFRRLLIFHKWSFFIFPDFCPSRLCAIHPRYDRLPRRSAATHYKVNGLGTSDFLHPLFNMYCSPLLLLNPCISFLPNALLQLCCNTLQGNDRVFVIVGVKLRHS